MNVTIPNIPVLATQINDSDLFEKADGLLAGQSQRVPASLLKTYLPSYFTFNAGGKSEYIGGDQTGNARGTSALDVQSFRISPSQVASGIYSSAIGYANTASGTYGSTVGYINTAIGSFSSAVGGNNTASGNYSSTVGYNNAASGSFSSAVGYSNTASGNYSSAVGSLVSTTVSNSTELGYWSNNTTRAGAVRINGTGDVSVTVVQSATDLTDGGATAGSEADGTLMRNGLAFRINVVVGVYHLAAYYNDSTGTVRKNINIGILS